MRNDAGNVLFLILIAVALFATLAYAVTQSSRSGTADISAEKARLRASEILQYFTEMDTAITRMRISSHVKDYALDFYYDGDDNFVLGNHANTNCTSVVCNVFDRQGGGVIGRHLENYTRTPMGNPERIVYIDIPGVGSSKPDIVFVMQQPQWEICQEINRMAGLGADAIYNTEDVTQQNVMYSSPIPVGEIPDATIDLLIDERVGTTSNTFCACRKATREECEANFWDPYIVHVLVAR